MEKHGLTNEEALDNFHVIDHKGLITCGRDNLGQNVSKVANRSGCSDPLDVGWRGGGAAEQQRLRSGWLVS